MTKKTPQLQRLEEVLRSSKLVSGGFMGKDERSILDIIDADAAELTKLGFTTKAVAARMQKITDIAKAGLGKWVTIDENRQAMVEEAKRSFSVSMAASGQICQTGYNCKA